MSTEPPSKSLAAIQGIIDAGRPLIYIQSAEEDRVIGLLSRIAEQRRGGRVDLFLWSATEGLQQNGKPVKNQPDGPRGVLDFVVTHDKPGLFLLKDFHEFMRDAVEIRRRLRDLYYRCLGTDKFAVICSPVKCIPEEINREVAFIELPRPDLKELEELLRTEAESVRGAGGSAGLSAETIHRLTRAVQGLTFHEARHALRRAMAEHGKLDESILQTLEQEKQQLVRKTGLIEYVPGTVGVEQIGGLDVLKTWLMERRELFFSRESISSEIVPKGLLLMGVSGCGKSLSARAVANVFCLPLYRIDMVQVFSAGVGNAERLFAGACRAMEEVSPAVVWFDEIENGISRHQQDETGALNRIFGFFLTWMQEKPAGLFVAATANRIDLLPAEMIRKGRFDQVFFIDLPDYDERLEIFKIHLSRRGVDPSTLRLDLIAERTEGWTGAEIEQAVIAALVSARLAKETVTDEHLFPALRQIVPLAKTMREQINHIRSWAFDRAVHASARKK
ncbi:MAG TPA: AAA family ATPase [Phycisphaerae bacterium]|nr:AAA family ATPase [Phycisphaerae bacterium]HRR86662.1 AAA family ATPase [Phycisphaerae bacterium]